MKKIYALGMAMMVCGSAIAAPNTISKVNDQPLPLGKIMNPSEWTAKAPEKAAPAKAVSSVDDLVGMYKWTYLGALQGQSGNQMAAVWIEKVNDTQVRIKAFPVAYANVPVVMNVDIAKKKVSIQNGQKCVDPAALGLTGYADRLLYMYILTENQSGGIDFVPVTAANADLAEGKINEDGSIEFPGYVAFGCSDPKIEPNGQYYSLGYRCKMELTKMNTIDEADYESIGMGKFTDCWINDRFTTPVVEDEEVEVLQNKTNPSLIVIKDPYASDIWKQNGNVSKTGKGYIQFNIADPDWVEVTVLTNSGYAEDMSEAGDGSVTDDFYMTNTEGYLSFLGGDIENTKQEWALVGDVPSNLTGNTITILHQLFTDAEAPLSQSWWGHYDNNDKWIEAERSEGRLILPAGWSGVSDIVSDFDAPVKYYNLQGIELAAPVKGQLTIKKQGNKTVKFIAK